jgi:hypothetical protein
MNKALSREARKFHEAALSLETLFHESALRCMTIYWKSFSAHASNAG